MFSKTSKSNRIDPEQREQYQYARSRVKEKKRLMRHFILFLAGSVILIIINPVLGIGKEFFIKDWFVWAILIWALLFLVHFFNVFILNRFMGREWEDRQIEKLKAKQEARIAELDDEVRKDVITSARVSYEALADAQVKKNKTLENQDPPKYPPEEA